MKTHLGQPGTTMASSTQAVRIVMEIRYRRVRPVCSLERETAAPVMEWTSGGRGVDMATRYGRKPDLAPGDTRSGSPGWLSGAGLQSGEPLSLSLGGLEGKIERNHEE